MAPAMLFICKERVLSCARDEISCGRVPVSWLFATLMLVTRFELSQLMPVQLQYPVEDVLDQSEGRF